MKSLQALSLPVVIENNALKSSNAKHSMPEIYESQRERRRLRRKRIVETIKRKLNIGPHIVKSLKCQKHR
jgi:hypothetical protein